VWEKYKDKGVVLLAVTNEPRGLVDAFVAKNGAKYPIVIESGDSLANFDGSAFPSAFVIGPDGKIAGNVFDDGLIDSLLPKQRIAPKLPDKLASVAKLFEKSKYADARKALETYAGGKVSVEEMTTANAVIKWIDDCGASSLASAAADEAGGNFGSAAETYEETAADFAGLDGAVKATDALKAMLADATKKKEVDGWKALVKAKAEAREISPKKAIALFKSVATKWKDTKGGQKAAAILAEMEKKPNK
jgi:hypothetical protein